MSAVSDAFAAASDRVESMRREGAERRDLRGKRAEEAKGKARESFSNQGPKMEKYAGHVAELVRRQRAAGGWATTSVVDKDTPHYDFGPEVDAAGHEDWPPQAVTAPSDANGPADPGLMDDPLAEGARSASVLDASPGRRSARPAVEDDDDDFSSRDWLS
ncbi:MAG: hypothetical protein ACRDRN_01845 [Sciscionella sp.]